MSGIAPREDIRSVRFDGDRGYVVTFEKTDPLFTFDLSEPDEVRHLATLELDTSPGPAGALVGKALESFGGGPFACTLG